MHFRIIELEDNLPDLLLFRFIDDDGNNCVSIRCVGLDNMESEDFQNETVEFKNGQTAKNFIRDYSKKSAAEWVFDKKLTYG